MTVAYKADKIKGEIKELRGKIDHEFQAYKDNPESMPDDVVAQLGEWDKQLEDKLEAYSEAAQNEQRAKSNREAMDQIFGHNGEPTSDGVHASRPKTAGVKPDTIESIAAEVMRHPEWKAWYHQMTGDGTRPISRDAGVRSPTIELQRSLIDPNAALVTGLSSTSGGALVVNDRLSTIVPAVRDELNIVDMVTRQTTISDTVEYVRVTTETNNAAPTAEATSSADGAKPESAVAMAVVTAVVENIAHWIPVTRRAASDANQLMSYINDFLMHGLVDTLDNQILNGDGNTPNLEGIANTSNVQSQAWDTDVLTTTRKARTKVKTVGGATPTAYLLTPENWESIDLLQDNENRYYFGGPQRMGMPVLWGLPVVESEKVTADTAYVGDWRQAVIWDREQATIHMTDSHSDFFIRNILVVLAEMRAAFGVLRPQAFVEIAMAQ